MKTITEVTPADNCSAGALRRNQPPTLDLAESGSLFRSPPSSPFLARSRSIQIGLELSTEDSTSYYIGSY
jgi:hypothetical protein